MAPNKTTYSCVTSLSVFVVNYVYVNNNRGLLTSYPRYADIGYRTAHYFRNAKLIVKNTPENQDQEKKSNETEIKCQSEIYLKLFEPI